MVMHWLAALLLTAAPDVTGRWEGGGVTLVLERNGTGSISDGPQVPPEALTWRLSGVVLAMTQNGDTIPYQVKLGAGSMTLTSVVLEGPLTLRRVGGAATATPAATPAPAARPQGPPVQAATCEGACRHYVGCAGLGPDALNACAAQCYAWAVTPPQLEAYVRLDCPSAVAVIVAAVQQAQQQNQPRKRNTSASCKGCVRDGNDCVWISQSNWGTGPNSPYSGAVSSCDPSCCAR
jgi:hypothetical protein